MASASHAAVSESTFGAIASRTRAWYASSQAISAGVRSMGSIRARSIGASVKRLEAVEGDLAAARRRERRDHDQALDPDAVLAGLVVARLVGQDHPGAERHVAPHLGDPLRALVDRQIAADTVARAVVEVEAGVPERGAGEGIELGAGGPLREARHRERDVAPEDPGEPVPLLGGGRTDGHRAGHVGGAVEVLRAGVDEVEHPELDAPVRARGRAVVDDGAVRARARDRGKAHVAEERLLRPERVEALGGARPR